jgi:hypothetical protein
MSDHRQTLPHAQQGFALLTAVIFALVLTIAGMGFFWMASHETRQALYRQSSSEAFYLADGAIERARAKLLEDRTWRDGWSGVSAGAGSYDLTIADTTYGGETDVVRLVATGTVRTATRKVAAFCALPPSAYGLTMLVMGSMVAGGNICLQGSAQINGNADFGPGDAHLQCGGEYTSGFTVTPPTLYTEPTHFPNATYYYVLGNKIHGTYQARIYDAAGNDITTLRGDSLTAITSYRASDQTFVYSFKNNARIQTYFDDASGVFRRAPCDTAVVVNFGEPPLIDPPGVLGVAEIEIDGSNSSRIHATVINTRFVGVTVEDRVDYNCWTGGQTIVKQIIMEPYYGIALVTASFMKQGGSHVNIGTAAWPALVYVTRHVTDVTANFELVGSIICLGNWNNTGTPDLIYDPNFVGNLPDYLQSGWNTGGSGTLRVLQWRELSSN